MRGFEPTVKHRYVPAPVALFNGVTRIRTALILDELDSTLFDRWAAVVLRDCELLLGASTSSLATGKAARRMGGTFVLDRACPDIRFQQAVMVEEAKKAGGTFKRNSPWFVERQVEEYEEANYILSPSNYSRNSFPQHLQHKIVLAPLYGRAKVSPRRRKPQGSKFLVGVVGNNPLRKGYMYLLQAWKELALPNAQLKIRSGSNFSQYPLLQKLIVDQPNVSIVDYVPDIGAFYGECDAFILPSVDDGFGMALFEALANGVPSIATRNCGASELLTDGKDSLIIDAFSVLEIKDSIRQLYESEDLRNALELGGPATVNALQQNGFARPYEESIQNLMHSILTAGHYK
jgi:glycosyltransferase involved in cell wall biosynthesis